METSRNYISFGMLEYCNKNLMPLEKWEEEYNDYPIIPKKQYFLIVSAFPKQTMLSTSFLSVILKYIRTLRG